MKILNTRFMEEELAMTGCPIEFEDEDLWIALSFFAFIIRSDKKLRRLEFDYFEKRLSPFMGSGGVDYFYEVMKRELDPEDLNTIGRPKNIIVAKFILKAAIALSLSDGEYAKEEKDSVKKWAGKNGLDESFVGDMESYVALNMKLDKIGEELLNKTSPNPAVHGILDKFSD